MVEGLVEIVAELGPIIADHAYRVYRERSGTARLTKKAISSLNRACYMALKSERIAQIQDNLSGQRPRTLFAPGTPPVVVRPIYGRQPDEIPFSELSLAAQELQLELDPYGSDWKRTLLQHFGHSNLTSAASAHLALLVSYRAEELGG